MKIPIDGFVFDLDGTVYLGEHALPGAVETLAELRRRGKRVVFISNKPLEPGSVYAEKLTRLGIPAEPGQVITSATSSDRLWQATIRDCAATWSARPPSNPTARLRHPRRH